MKKSCYVCGGYIRPGGNHVVVIGETLQRPKAVRHINCYPGSKKYMENPDLAKSYLDMFRRAGESDTQVRERIGPVAVENRNERVLNITKKAVEPDTCGCREPLFTLADGTKGCPSCGEQY